MNTDLIIALLYFLMGIFNGVLYERYPTLTRTLVALFMGYAAAQFFRTST